MSIICQCCGQTIRAKRTTRVAKSFTGYDDFVPAFNAARHAAIVEPGAALYGRVPAAWASCKVYGRSSNAPRDQRFPAAQYWPGGMLPAGPEYERPAVEALAYGEAA